MNLILYAGYADKEHAEGVFGELLEMGVAAEDLSLVCRAERLDEAEIRGARRMVDAGQAHPEEVRIGPGRVQAEGLDGIESAVGAGIATINFDDDASGVEEMDEGQELAENLSEPLNSRSYGEEDAADARRFAELGTIDATRPPDHGFNAPPPDFRSEAPDRSYTATVLGQVLTLGDGVLSTELLTANLSHHESDAVQAVRLGLNRAGVPAEESVELSGFFENGGAVLAVTEAPGRIPMAQLEAFVEESGAKAMRVFRQRQASV